MMSEYRYTERKACKLMSIDRSTYRYQPRPDHNAELRSKLLALARQKPRYGYRRLAALLERGGSKASPQRVYPSAMLTATPSCRPDRKSVV